MSEDQTAPVEEAPATVEESPAIAEPEGDPVAPDQTAPEATPAPTPEEATPKGKATKAKALNVTSPETAAVLVPDIQKFGDPDEFQLIAKASSQEQGWMKSTKAKHIEGAGCLVQVSTQQRNPDGSYAVAEALAFVPCVNIYPVYGDDGVTVVGRSLAQ